MKPNIVKREHVRRALVDPVCGDLFEKNGERRSVVLRRREDVDAVFYLRYSQDGDRTPTSATYFCTLSAWCDWAVGAEILHAAVRPFKPPGPRGPRRKLKLAVADGKPKEDLPDH